MVKPVAKISVIPNLPAPLERLRELAYNLRWSWDHDTVALFRRLDPELWQATHNNPVWMLGLLSQERLNAAAHDPAYLASLQHVLEGFDAYMSATDTWYTKTYGVQDPTALIAYFSMEFGLAACFQNYSGGLGILSGDHLKSASDLGLPLVGVGLLYQEGYFQQYLNADGFQQESYPVNDFANLPLTRVTAADGKPLLVSVPLPGRTLHAAVWRLQAGRIALYLLDTNIPENPRADDRNLTDRLYGGDRRTRIRQEILMGIGGIRMLDAVGLRPTICHMNEGHSAFLALERARQAMHDLGIGFDEAREITSAGNVFTTHTPVPAGLERFGFDLIDEHFPDYWRELGLTREQFIDLGREKIEHYELFSMPVLAQRFSAKTNGVAKLHGRVSREMWQWAYPNLPTDEVPIGSVTNGIHVMTWISAELASLFDRYLDPQWRQDTSLYDVWQGVYDIPDAELWRSHERRRERLVAFARQQLRRQLAQRGLSQSEVEAADEVLNPDVLTVGFARRFATYKRATMFMRDTQWLHDAINHPTHPVQFIFAGKAHPHDTEGKEFIRKIVQLSRDPAFRHGLVFLENYDMRIARYLYQGCDVWLNNPRRPKEASGTSGMKTAINGCLNFSILDGWWDEGYDPSVGWAIGNGEEYPAEMADFQDEVEGRALMNVLTNDIIPTFYNRSRDGLPREWIDKMKHSIARLAPLFNTRRMVREYAEDYYMPAHQRYVTLSTPTPEKARQYMAWRDNVQRQWGQVRVTEVRVADDTVRVGEQVRIEATVALGSLAPEDVVVQLYYGLLNARGDIGQDAYTMVMEPAERNGEGTMRYGATLPVDTSGERGLSVRVLPNNPLMPTPFLPGLITWAS